MSRRHTRRVSRRTQRKAMVDINVVPYIDVMLVLLIVFMITTPLLTTGVKVDLPKAQAQTIQATPEKPIVVTVNAQGQYFLNQGSEQPLSAQGLRQQVATLRQQAPDKPIYVRGDDSAMYGQVVNAMVLLQQAGVEKVGLVTDGSKD